MRRTWGNGDVVEDKPIGNVVAIILVTLMLKLGKGLA
jgi:hypothetical protein